MQLDGLRPLYASMSQQGIKRYKFDHRHGRAVFDVIFLTDVTPYDLIFGCRGTTFAFCIKVKTGFIIEPYLGDDYGRLCEVLGLRANAANPFSPTAFFREFNARVPPTAHPANAPRPHEIGRYVRTFEDPDKIYFCGWRDNSPCGEHVTKTNLAKTKKLMGDHIAEWCLLRNISTCWTADSTRAVEVRVP